MTYFFLFLRKCDKDFSKLKLAKIWADLLVVDSALQNKKCLLCYVAHEHNTRGAEAEICKNTRF